MQKRMVSRIMTRDAVIIAAAAALGGLLGAVGPAAFDPAAWALGVGLGVGQSLAGVRVYRSAMRRRDLALGPALGSGFLRVLLLLLCLAAAVRVGIPATPFAWALLCTYAAMMCAEIAVVARAAQPVRQEAR